MNKRCQQYDELLLKWFDSQSNPIDAAEAKAALMAHAAECEACTQAVKSAWAASKPLPIYESEEK